MSDQYLSQNAPPVESMQDLDLIAELEAIEHRSDMANRIKMLRREIDRRGIDI